MGLLRRLRETVDWTAVAVELQRRAERALWSGQGAVTTALISAGRVTISQWISGRTCPVVGEQWTKLNLDSSLGLWDCEQSVEKVFLYILVG